jgi:hypothetical protein
VTRSVLAEAAQHVSWSTMQMLDVLAAALVVGAAASFTFGATALSRASDVEAIYFLVVGVVALRAGVQLVRPGAGA